MNAAHFKAARPHQWLKNLLLFVPMFSAHQINWPNFAATATGVVAFSLAASAIYVINDLADIEADRKHPRKRNRPFASGAVPTAHGPWMASALLVAGAAVSMFLGLKFSAVLLLYVVATTAYTFYFKQLAVWDIFGLAGLYSLRVLAGGVAVHIRISVWLLAFSVFIFLSLAALKRQAELVALGDQGDGQVPRRGYRKTDYTVVAQVALVSGFSAVLVMATYINAPEIFALYRSPTALWGICLSMLFWITRASIVTHRGEMDDDPLIFAVRDPISLLCLVVAGVSILWARYL